MGHKGWIGIWLNGPFAEGEVVNAAITNGTIDLRTVGQGGSVAATE